MQEVLRKLEQVQELDIQINAILRKKAEFPQRLVGYDADLKTNGDKYQEKKKIVDELEKGRRQQLGALELNDERAKRSQEKLEQIKTNQEYQALLKEIESLKKNSTVIQENANKVGEELERHKKEMLAYEVAMNEAKSKLDAETAKIGQEERILNVDLTRLQELRRDGIVGIDQRYLSAYERVRINRSGVGIVGASGGNCKGCNMRIPPQIYNELQRGGELHMCPSCKRILVYKDAVKGNSSTSSATASG